MYGTSQHVQTIPARRDRGGLPFLTLGVGLAMLAGIGYVTADVARAARGESAASGALEAKHLRSAAPRQPHLLLVTLDDVGWDDFGEQSGELSALTPRLSKLAAGGVRLTGLYGQSLCTPARAALHTGKFVHRLGFNSLQMEAEVTAFSNFSIPIRHRLLAQRLSEDAGYATAFAGKWNVGHCNSSYPPTARGFDSFVGYFTAGIGYTTTRRAAVTCPAANGRRASRSTTRHVQRRDGFARDERRVRRARQRRDLRERGDRGDRDARREARAGARARAARAGRGSRPSCGSRSTARTTTRAPTTPRRAPRAPATTT